MLRMQTIRLTIGDRPWSLPPMLIASPLDARTAAFAGLVVVLVITPGLNTAVVTQLVLERGRANALWGIAGVSAGTVAQSLAAAGGLSTILLASPAVFRGVQLAGAAYVFYLGARAVHAS